MRDLAIDYRPIEALIPYARNARTHSDAQVAQIAASIREFGWTNPVLVDGESGIIAKAVGMMKPNRFACFVVGEVRDRDGIYRNFVGDTIAAFEDAGARYYNEAVLITATGSLAIRAGKQFSTSRKLGKTHQNVLVFVKGDPRRATEACGVVEIDDSLFEAEASE